jgi:hypothetical protein
MAPQANEITIVGGPSKFDLMVSLFGTNREKRTVYFDVVGPVSGIRVSAEFVIAAVEREDGSGESWLIQGWRLTRYVQNREWAIRTEELVPFKGYFSTKSRRGHLKESPKS